MASLKAMRKLDAADEKKRARSRQQAATERRTLRQNLLARLEQYSDNFTKGDLLAPVTAKLDEDGLEALLKLLASVHTGAFSEGVRDEELRHSECES